MFRFDYSRCLLAEREALKKERKKEEEEEEEEERSTINAGDALNKIEVTGGDWARLVARWAALREQGAGRSVWVVAVVVFGLGLGLGGRGGVRFNAVALAC